MIAQLGQMRDDGLEPVVLAAEPVHGDDDDVGIRRTVVPVRGGAAEHRRSRRTTGMRSTSAA